MEIRPELREAFQIFLGELGGNITHFKRLLEQGGNLEEHAKNLGLRFHTIKGGAGFLKLTEIAALADRGEKLFSSGNLQLEEFSELVASLESQLNEIS